MGGRPATVLAGPSYGGAVITEAGDLPNGAALVMAVTRKAPLGSASGDAATAPAWRDKPVRYQVSTEDRMIHPDNERRTARRMSPRKVVGLDASHASPASRAKEVVDLVEEAVRAAAG
ncbi:hypothetical protein GCM10010363_53540 [Streptomyces omiyaensis]|uniref:hypothetical protein n=1 Tax=Streptomyces omiyaensis TaxID=68247 RepID=UPI00199669B8|nr:hypothetical protein [Streptomyces omiyaensis]GGY65396.1 hypothetical protein GCM10010363_53540 [Streptomyces omiyaensis]